jgi:two-component system NtrC family sensor kinase
MSKDKQNFASELEKRIYEKTAELSLLYDISGNIHRSINQEDLARCILESLQKLIGCEVSCLLITQGDSSIIYIHLARDMEKEQLERIAAEAGSSLHELSGSRPTNLKTVIFKSPSYIKELSIPPALDFFHTIPLGRGEKTIGMIGLFGVETLEEGKERILYTIANQSMDTLDRLISLKEVEENKFRAVVDGMGEGVVLTSLKDAVIMTNPAADRIFFKLHLDNDRDFIKALGKKEWRQSVAGIKKGQHPSFSGELVFQKQGAVIHVTASGVQDSRGNINGIVYVFSDMTEQRKLQQQMIQTEKLTALGELISGVAHELNNPLSAVMGYAQLLQQGNIPNHVKERLEIINRESKRCQRIVQNLLLFARRHEIKKKKIDLHDVLESVLQVLSYQWTVDQIEMEKRYSKDPLLIYGDFHQIQQVFLNILNNAHQAILEVKRKGKIKIKTGLAGEKIIVEIKDNGSGIRKENLERIFEPFYTTKDAGQGTGLGLSLAYESMRDHEGDIKVRSQPGRSSTFYLEFASLSHAGEEKKRKSQKEKRALLTGKKILVVDDEKEIYHVIEEALREKQPSIIYAPDGQMALSKMRESEFDLIISDFKMPHLNGEDLLKKIHKDFPGLKGKILFITGDIASPSTREFLKKKKAKFLEKPFDISEFQRTVEKVISDS